jgi:cytochrome c553
MPSSSGSTASSSGGSSSGGVLPVAAPPDAGPGSTASAAHEYFDSTVYPQLSVCQACHGTAATTTGAPQMMTAPADTAYSDLDALGLIVTNSLLLTKGSHDNGAAPALTSTQSSDITTWLGMEAQERAGTAAPTNVLAEVAQCVSQSDWNNIDWGKLLTQPRTDENANKCSGCNYALCASCHDGGEQGFFMAEGSNIEPPGTTFQQTFQGPQAMTYIIQYFGLNGTTPVASNAIMLKQQAVATGPAYSHPMFVMPSDMQTALNTFVTNTITNYNNHTCTGTADGGAGEDAGP